MTSCEGVDWINLIVQDRVQCRNLVNVVTKLRISQEGEGGFLDQLSDFQILIKVSAP